MLANDIGRYFVRKIERIRTDIDSIHLHPQDQDLVPSDGVTNRTLNSFNNLSERNVSDLINNSAKKSCVLDPMPTCLIYDSLDVLLPVITRMVNASLSTEHFPDEWTTTSEQFAIRFEDHRESGFEPDLCPRNRKWTVSRITIGVQKCT